MTIKAVLFDLDDTLLWDDRSVKEAFQAACEEAAKQAAVKPQLLEESVRREARALYESFETYPFTKMIGINPFEGLWAHFSEGDNENFKRLREWAPYYRTESWTRGLAALGINDKELGKRLGERFAAERRARPFVYEETFKVLNELKGKYKLLLLTNGSPDLQKEKITGVPELASYFDHIVISGNFGQGKPAAAIFEHAMDLLHIHSEEGIMVGDKLTTDIMGALGVGMKAVWINRHHVTRSDEIIPNYTISHLSELHNILNHQ